MKAIFLASLLCSASSYAATIQLGAPVTVTSSTFDVDVEATNVFANFPDEAVTGFGFNVTVTPGVTFIGESVDVAIFDDISGCCVGTDVVVVSQLLSGVVADPLILATLHFSLSGSGPVTVGVTADNSADPDQGLYFLTGAESFSASEDVGITTPEPATILLSVLGLCGMGVIRRKTRKLD